jgi:hypothetical protein
VPRFLKFQIRRSHLWFMHKTSFQSCRQLW